MFRLSNLSRLCGRRKRVGRGGSRGGSSGRGCKGQKARTGSSSELRPFFEGGQMPLPRRLPARGFTNRFAKKVKIVSLSQLNDHFSAGDSVDLDSLRKAGLIKGRSKFYVKLLANGKLDKSLSVSCHFASKAAIDAVEAAGGKVSLLRESGGDSSSA